MEEAKEGLVWGRLTLARQVLSANARPTPKPALRFWIISMMLVLVGLSTLKLR
jgi:UDP-N-acetylmuramyl pentapeptide phosphotransferase/UDP-N-acetylglucosamine-1-phosphate transferase